MKITFLVGLPGSGKTHYGNLLAEGPNVVYIDDISVREDPMREIQLAMGVEHILISDVFLCREEERKKRFGWFAGLPLWNGLITKWIGFSLKTILSNV